LFTPITNTHHLSTTDTKYLFTYNSFIWNNTRHLASQSSQLMFEQNNKITTKMKNTKMNIFTTLRYSISHKHSTNNINFTKSNQKTTQTEAPNIYIYPQKKPKHQLIQSWPSKHSTNTNQTDIIQQSNKIQQPKQLITTNEPWSIKITTIKFNQVQQINKTPFKTTHSLLNKKLNATHYLLNWSKIFLKSRIFLFHIYL
jgi:hypothetical protein